MKYPLLASAVSLVFVSGSALAAGTEEIDETTTTTTTIQEDTTTTTEPGPATVAPVELFFNLNSAQLGAQADPELEPLAKWAKCSKNRAIILEGHADPTGTVAYNAKLSAKRAANVRESLLAMGVPSSRIVVSVFGETGPQRATHAEDRRVTVRAMPGPVAAADLAPSDLAD